MAFATGRDDESELIAGFRDDAVVHRDIVLSMFMLGNQTAMQHAAGRAMVGAVVVQHQQQQQQQQVQQPIIPLPMPEQKTGTRGRQLAE